MRFRLLIEYDGTGYAGWQVQRNKETVQGEIEQALRVLLKMPVKIVGAGRTDAGVHARGQVAHFDSHVEISPPLIQRSLNGILKQAICIINIDPCADTFHARYSAKSRTYHYQISTRPLALGRNFAWQISYDLDLKRMQKAADMITGTHDFKGFCRSLSDAQNYLCTVFLACWRQKEHLLLFEISANRFLHGMVRAIVGTLIDIGRGKTASSEITSIIEGRQRRLAGQSAPAHGLVFDKVEY